MFETDIRLIYQRLTSVEEHNKRIEAILAEREGNRVERAAELLRQIQQLDAAVQDLTRKTRNHLIVQSCVDGGKKALQWGSMGGGLVATVVLLGKLLGFW